MKNVMNRFQNKLAMTAILLAVLAFAGCSDLDDSKNAAVDRTVKVCTVTGKVTIGGTSGATSSALQANIASFDNVARSATSSLPTSNLESFSLYAYKGSGINVDTSVKVDGEIDAVNMTYSILLPQTGDWLLCAVAYDSNGIEVLVGRAVLTVTDDYKVEEDTSITLKPEYGQNGKINLTITDGTDDKKIASLSFSGTVLSSDSGNENSLSKDVLGSNSTVNFSNGTAKIELDSVKPNCYEVTFSFYDAENGEGNLLYKCKDTVTVFSGFTTDTWYGEGSHLVKTGDTVEFVVTDELVEKHGKTVEFVPSTNYLLYSAYSEEGNGTNTNGYRYYFVESPNETLDTASATTSLETSGSTMPANSFCFDADGNYYALIKNSSGYAIKSNKFTEAITVPLGIESLSGIMIDMKTNILYAWYGFQTIYNVYKFANLISSGDSEYETVPGGDFEDEWFYHDNTRLVINDGTVYGWVGSSIDGKLYTVDTSETSPNANFVSFSYSSLGLSGSESITDMLYQDGAVYLLARNVSQSGSVYYSRGAVIRYDTVFGSFKVLGYSNTPNSATALQNAKIGAYHNSGLICEENTLTKAIYVDGSHSWTNSMGTFSLYNCLPKFYTPAPLSSTLSNSEFYGPVKFVALKPKKLVIADDGLAFYIDTDNVLKYKNVNRVVTVDLESLSIIATNTTASLNGDSSDVKTCFSESTSTAYQGAFSEIIPNSTIYYYNGSEFISWNASASETQLGIPCKD